MPVHPQAQAVLDYFEAQGGPPVHTLKIDQVRARAHEIAERFYGSPVPVRHVANRTIAGPGGPLHLRLYYPEGQGPCPVLLYYHGGGWTVCDLDTHDRPCRRLCQAAGCLVISVDYRRGPEHPFPAAVEDAYAAVEWVAEHAGEIDADETRIAVGGDSAGGNLSAVACLLARDRQGPRIAHQLLIYPVTDHYDPGTASYRENAEGYFLTRDLMIWFFDQYLRPEQDTQHPHLAPLRADTLAGLPPALVLTAEYDPLRDEGELYARRLQADGVPTVLRRYDGMIHGFFAMPDHMDAGRDAIVLAAAELRKVFGQE